jgi:hypothetical protein
VQPEVFMPIHPPAVIASQPARPRTVPKSPAEIAGLRVEAQRLYEASAAATDEAERRRLRHDAANVQQQVIFFEYLHEQSRPVAF